MLTFPYAFFNGFNRRINVIFLFCHFLVFPICWSRKREVGKCVPYPFSSHCPISSNQRHRLINLSSIDNFSSAILFWNAGNRAQGCCVSSKYATNAQCIPPPWTQHVCYWCFWTQPLITKTKSLGRERNYLATLGSLGQTSTACLPFGAGGVLMQRVTLVKRKLKSSGTLLSCPAVPFDFNWLVFSNNDCHNIPKLWRWSRWHLAVELRKYKAAKKIRPHAKFASLSNQDAVGSIPMGGGGPEIF